MDRQLVVYKQKKGFWKLFFKGVLALIEWSIVISFALISILAVLPMLPTKKYVQTYVIPTGSMTPTIQVGALAFTSPTLDTISTGEIIAFTDPEDKQKTVLHRIVDIKAFQGRYVLQTKGDHNNAPDPWLLEQSLIRGKFLFSIPYVGYVMSFLKTQLGFFLFIGIPSVLLIFIEFKHIKEGIDEEVARRIRAKSSQEFFPKFFILLLVPFALFPTLKQNVSAQGILLVSRQLGPMSVSVKNFQTPSLSFTRVGKNSIQFQISNSDRFDAIAYTLTYDTATASQGVRGNSALHSQKHYTSPVIVLGTCSSGICVYDKGVHNIHLTVQLTNKTSSFVLSQSL